MGTNYSELSISDLFALLNYTESSIKMSELQLKIEEKADEREKHTQYSKCIKAIREELDDRIKTLNG